MKASQDSTLDSETEQEQKKNQCCCKVRGGYQTNRCVYL